MKPSKSKKEKETKQNPVVELSGLCYNLLIKVVQIRVPSKPKLTYKVSWICSGLGVYPFGVGSENPLYGSCSASIRDFYRTLFLLLPLFQSVKYNSHRLLVLLVPYFNERSTRSESIISNLTTKVKNVLINSQFQWLNRAVKSP